MVKHLQRHEPAAGDIRLISLELHNAIWVYYYNINIYIWYILYVIDIRYTIIIHNICEIETNTNQGRNQEFHL